MLLLGLVWVSFWDQSCFPGTFRVEGISAELLLFGFEGWVELVVSSEPVRGVSSPRWVVHSSWTVVLYTFWIYFLHFHQLMRLKRGNRRVELERFLDFLDWAFLASSLTDDQTTRRLLFVTFSQWALQLRLGLGLELKANVDLRFFFFGQDSPLVCFEELTFEILFVHRSKHRLFSRS